ncbi:hypothetical protein VP01_8137g1, partial [Puccinia sorghi]
LHVVLLGIVKYLTTDLMKKLTTSQSDELEARLWAFKFEGLKLAPIQPKQMVAHHGSFIGKEYQMVLQEAPFFIFPLMNSDMKQIWQAFCVIGICLSKHTLKIGMYSVINENLSPNSTCCCIYLIPSDGTVQFIPTVQAHEEIWPNSFSYYQLLRSLVSGTKLLDKSRGCYFQASSQAREIFDNNPIIQESLGYNSSQIIRSEKFPCLHGNHSKKDANQISSEDVIRDGYFVLLNPSASNTQRYFNCTMIIFQFIKYNASGSENPHAGHCGKKNHLSR